jgi:predicted nicotinamide N-methyase
MTTLSTSVGEIPLEEYNLSLGGYAWKIRHSGAILSRDDEQRFLGAEVRLPYGIVLWPAAIALAHELVAVGKLDNKRVLELGAGTGLPGIIAATLGASKVVQTDNQETALFLCKDNAARNRVMTEVRAADWTAWASEEGFDLILGSDILYGEAMHPHLRRIFDLSLAPGGTVLLADPLRKQSFPLFEAMEADGWRVSINKWTVGVRPPPRAIGVFKLTKG